MPSSRGSSSPKDQTQVFFIAGSFFTTSATSRPARSLHSRSAYSTVYCDRACNLGFPHSSVSKESACNAGDLGSIPGSGRSPGEGNGNSLQYSCLGNPMDRGAWRAAVHGVAELGTTEQLCDYHFNTLHCDFLVCPKLL